MKLAICALWISLAAGGSAAAQSLGTVTPDAAHTDADLKAALINRVDTAKRSVGIIVGILTPEGRRYLVRGVTDKEIGAAPDADTMFEIGSITKVFTSLLLADMVERGEVKLDDPIASYLPAAVKIPSRNDRSITLVDLATHTSGLPRLPANLGANFSNPYAHYETAQLYEFLSSYTLPRDPGEKWEYSNLGGGLLGHILSRRAGMSYEELLRRRVLEPLGMKSTTITLSTEQRRLMASGYNFAGLPTGNWDFDVLAGGGAIRSTASDMLNFAAAELGLVEHPLKAAMERMLSVTRPSPSAALSQHLGWLVIGGTVLFHDGGTGGYRSALAIRPSTRQAVIVLSNSTQDVSDIAIHGVVPEQPLLVLEAPK